MAAFRGGGAAKLGFRYEDWWTLLRVADLLRGDAVRLRLEPPGAEGEGVEFWVDERDGTRWYEQVKHDARSWTITALKNEGVLAAFAPHLAAGHRIRFVSSSPAAQLSHLTERATKVVDADEFRTCASLDDVAWFRAIARVWDVDEQVAWSWLTRITVEHHPAATLRRIVLAVYEGLVRGDPDVIVDILRGFLVESLHRPLTGPQVWNHLESKGFRRRLLPGDQTTTEALRSTVGRHRRRVDGARPASGLVTRPEVSALRRVLEAEPGKVVVVHGRAGSGKSTVVREVVEQLEASGWFSAVAGMDAVGADTRSARALGRTVDLEGSPAVLLDGVAAGTAAILAIDQLDAVSTFSGRMPASFESVTELLEQAEQVANLAVVLVVRTVDLEADQRMRSLLDDTARVTTFEVSDLERDDLRRSLNDAGVDVDALRPATLELLRTPLHYALFLRLSPTNRHDDFRALPELYDRFIAQVRTDVGSDLAWTSIIPPMVEDMTTREQLHVPALLLDDVSPQHISALCSHGLLVVDGDRLMFAHETLFDHLFARAFVQSGRDLHDFLVTSGQRLFRRAQTRQVLEFLARHDRTEFHRVVRRLLTSTTLRRHLRAVVITVLAHLDATVEDWQLVESLAFPPAGAHRPDLIALLSRPHWFDAADRAGRWPALLADESRTDHVMSQLIGVASERPARVAELVRPFAGSSDAWRARLWHLVAWRLHAGLVELAVELLDAGDLDDITAPIAANGDFWMLLFGLAKEDADGAARVIGAFLRRCLTRARAAGIEDPFDSPYLSNHSPGGGSTIEQVARDAPATFVREVLPFIAEVAQRTATAHRDGELRVARWAWPYVGPDRAIDAALYAGVESALLAVASSPPSDVVDAVAALTSGDIRDLSFLVCRFFTAAGRGDDAITWLLADRRRMGLGWADSSRWATSELIRATTRICSQDVLAELSSALLSFYPARETTAEGRAERGWAQFTLLAALDPTRRSAEVTARLGELARKFPDETPVGPHPVEFQTVDPPVPRDAAEHLTDDDWLRLVRKWPDDRTEWRADAPVGGHYALASLIGDRAAVEPERFARLALRFDATMSSAPLCRILEAVGGKIPSRDLAELAHHARDVGGPEVGRSICFAISHTADDAGDEFVSLLGACAGDDDPVIETARTPAGSGTNYFGGDLAMAGLNCTRGAAAHACARVLAHRPHLADRLAPLVARLATDPIMAVRVQAAAAVTALLKPMPDTALSLASDLFTDVDIEIVDTNPTAPLLRTALLQDPDTFAPLVNRALAGPEAVARRAGMVWAAASRAGRLAPPLATELADLNGPARAGAAALLASAADNAPDELAALFDDADPDVRRAAARALYRLDDTSPATTETLLVVFATSAAFADNIDGLIHWMARTSHPLPSVSVDICERAVRVGGRELGDISTRGAAISADLVTVILRLYRKADELTRERCLNMIDDLTEVRAFGLEALSDER